MFGFIKEMKDTLSLDDFKYIYNLLTVIQEDISPSNDFCPPFREYALNCVSQSNSKNARTKRLQFYHELFLNDSKWPNVLQSEVMKFYEIGEYQLFKLGTSNFHALPLEDIKKVK